MMFIKHNLFFLSLFITLSLAAQTELIVPVASEPGLNAEADAYLLAQPTTIWVNYVAFQLDEINTTDTFNVRFHAEDYNITFDRKEERGLNNYSWFGTSIDRDGSIIISVLGSDDQGIFTKGNEIYRLLTTANKITAIVHIDQSKYPAEACFTSGALIPGNQKNANNHSQQKEANHIKKALENGCNIKGLVLYTPAAEASMKGSGDPMLTDVKNAIQQAVEVTNQAFKNSEITTYDPIELVQISQLNFEEEVDSIVNDLYRLKDSITVVQNLRNQYNADFVMLITDTLYEGCGVAFLGGSKDWAYGIVQYNCMIENLSFAHEFGHLFGADHDANAISNPQNLNGYNHGYIYYAEKWRTIMSYNAPCDAMEFNCKRVRYFSNPDVNYPIGNIPMGSVAKENNAKTCRDNFDKIARFNQPDNNFSLTNNTYSNNGNLYSNVLAKQNITSSGSVTIQDNSTLILEAGECIKLNAGFSVEQKADVDIKIETIEDCP